MTIDIDEQRLRDAVVEAALEWHNDEYGVNDAGTPIDIACCALRNHRAKASAPEPARCEPDDSFRQSDGSFPSVAHGDRRFMYVRRKNPRTELSRCRVPLSSVSGGIR